MMRNNLTVRWTSGEKRRADRHYNATQAFCMKSYIYKWLKTCIFSDNYETAQRRCGVAPILAPSTKLCDLLT